MKHVLGIDFGASKTIVICEKENFTYDNSGPAANGIPAYWRYDKNEQQFIEEPKESIKAVFASYVRNRGNNENFYQVIEDFLYGVFYVALCHKGREYFEYTDDISFDFCVGYPPSGVSIDMIETYKEELRNLICNSFLEAYAEWADLNDNRKEGLRNRINVECVAEPVLGAYSLLNRKDRDDGRYDINKAFNENPIGLCVDIGHGTTDFAIVEYDAHNSSLKVKESLCGGTEIGQNFSGNGCTLALKQSIESARRDNRVKGLSQLANKKVKCIIEENNTINNCIAVSMEKGEAQYLVYQKHQEDASMRNIPSNRITYYVGNKDIQEVYRQTCEKLKEFLKDRKIDNVGYIIFVGGASGDREFHNRLRAAVADYFNINKIPHLSITDITNLNILTTINMVAVGAYEYKSAGRDCGTMEFEYEKITFLTKNKVRRDHFKANLDAIKEEKLLIDDKTLRTNEIAFDGKITKRVDYQIVIGEGKRARFLPTAILDEKKQGYLQKVLAEDDGLIILADRINDKVIIYEIMGKVDDTNNGGNVSFTSEHAQKQRHLHLIVPMDKNEQKNHYIIFGEEIRRTRRRRPFKIGSNSKYKYINIQNWKFRDKEEK